MKYITRFAPSPTGLAHVGNIRTALFDYLTARSTGGEFYLRIEDTDRERFVPEAVDYIHASLTWLGLKHDGEVIYQSNRLKIYQKIAEKLLLEGKAYKCYCTSERLRELKEEQVKNSQPPTYDRKCLNLSEKEVKEHEEKKTPYVIRFKIPEKRELISWDDKVRGKVSFDSQTLEDFIIIKSDGWPTYNLAHIVDDHEQKINLVVRGEEFIPSTPKYILIHRALTWEHPEYAHMPLTIGKDKKKLSKRHGDTAILDYKEKGYLPEAMVNFLALLGWNPGGGETEEVFSLNELARKFRIEDVNKAPAVFDLDRLDWMNGIWIRKLTPHDLMERIIAFDPKINIHNNDYLERIVTVEQTRLKTLADFEEISGFYFKLPAYDGKKLIFAKSEQKTTERGLVLIKEYLTNYSWLEKTVDDFETVLKKIVEKNGLNNGDVYWPVRYALSGLDKSPSPAELLWVLGREESLKRLETALEKIKA